jgi:hypothetical protein
MLSNSHSFCLAVSQIYGAIYRMVSLCLSLYFPFSLPVSVSQIYGALSRKTNLRLALYLQ